VYKHDPHPGTANARSGDVFTSRQALVDDASTNISALDF
jgi:hypothetical protein